MDITPRVTAGMKGKSFNQNVPFFLARARALVRSPLFFFSIANSPYVRRGLFAQEERTGSGSWWRRITSPVLSPWKSNATASKVHARGHARKFLGFANFCVRFVRSAFPFLRAVGSFFLLLSMGKDVIERHVEEYSFYKVQVTLEENFPDHFADSAFIIVESFCHYKTLSLSNKTSSNVSIWKFNVFP